MDQHRRYPRLCFLLISALTLAGVILRTVCMLCFFDADVGYFQRGVLPTLGNALYFAAVGVAIVCMALTPKNILPDETSSAAPSDQKPESETEEEPTEAPVTRIILPTELHTPGRVYAALLMGLALGCFTVATLLGAGPITGVSGKVSQAANLLGLIASFYFFCSAHKNGRYPDWLSFLGYLPVIWAITAVADTYFDVYVTMNSPVKLSVQMGLLGFMLIMLAELRFRVGKALPRYAVAFLSVGSFTCLTGSVPLLISFAGSYLNGASARLIFPARYALYAAVLLAAGVYGAYLLFRYITAPANPPHNAE